MRWLADAPVESIMSEQETREVTDESTPVDDVRGIRHRLSAEYGNDVRRLASHVNGIGEALRERLGLRRPSSDEGGLPQTENGTVSEQSLEESSGAHRRAVPRLAE